MEESNMSAPESTKFQVNYKLADGTLINLYATSVQELETGLADIAMNALNIRATGNELSGGSAPAPAPTVAAVAAAFNATPVAAARRTIRPMRELRPAIVPAARRFAREGIGRTVCRR